ncbi:MAG: hypothetical protein HYY40_14035 [Bacteroidetes bacterium]|nr:hypothetical protein [Bacteroidota bacterium]
MSITNNQLEVKPYTKKELAGLYGISPRSFCTWFKKIEHDVGKKQGKYFTVNQVRLIVEKLGLPGTIGESQNEVQPKTTTHKK